MTFLKRWFGRQSGPTRLELRLVLETMVLMMAADGVIEDGEMVQFMAQVRGHPQLRQMSHLEVEQHLQDATKAIKKEGPSVRLRAIARGLPDKPQRMAALTMALAVALGDKKMGRAEEQVLQMMRKNFSLSQEDVDEALKEAAHSHISSTKGITLEQAYMEVMLLMAAADGHLDAEEMEHFGHQLAHHQEFEQITPEQVGIFLEISLEKLENQNIEERIQELSAQLTDIAQKRTAFRLAVEICMSDGSADPRERALLHLLQESLGLTNEEVEQALQQTVGALR